MNPELQKLLAKLAGINDQLAAAANGIENILAAADDEDDPRELTEEESEQIAAARSKIETLTKQRECTQERIENKRAALEAESHSRVIRTSGDGQSLEINGRLEPNGPVSETLPDRGFRDLGEMGSLVYQAGLSGARIDERLLPLSAASGASMGLGSDGGFLVPPAFSQPIWDGVRESPRSLISLCDTYQVPVGADSITFNAVNETSRATGSRFGGIRGYWKSEAAQMTQSNPTFRQMTLEPQQLYVFCYVTDKLLKHASVLSQFLTRAATDEIAFMIGDSIINGDGVGKPTGIVGAPGTIDISAETDQGATQFVRKNISKMWARMLGQSRPNALWFANQDIEPYLEDMAMDVGTGGVPVYLPAGGIADAPLARLKGRQVQPLEYCATAGTSGDLILADMRYYALGLRGEVETGMSMHLRFDYNETAFRWIFEVDGESWLASAQTPYKGTDTQAPFLTLETRS